MKYKISYSHRIRFRNGEYALINHQALMLTMDDNGGYGKSLNNHTNTCKISLIGLNGEPSFMNLSLNEDNLDKEFSRREIGIIKLISDGLNNNEIAKKKCLLVH